MMGDEVVREGGGAQNRPECGDFTSRKVPSAGSGREKEWVHIPQRDHFGLVVISQVSLPCGVVLWVKLREERCLPPCSPWGNISEDDHSVSCVAQMDFYTRLSCLQHPCVYI